ncbi:MAG: hypothetical protein Q4A02_00535 [Bacteroidales bacterium]|nr:hypothetical protein [Bacteroidales bacterium]
MMDVRARFVSEVLQDEGQRLLRNQGKAIEARVKKRSGRLESSRSVSVTGGSGASGTLTFVHVAYERFLDMKRLQRGDQSVKSNRRIHNRYVFGAFASIAERLMNEFTEDAVARIKAADQGKQ